MGGKGNIHGFLIDMTYLQAKKSLGQNFLNSPGIAKKIVDISGVTENDTVLEIGPGKGMLTEILLARAKKVVAIEKDSRAMPILQERFAAEIAAGKLELIEGDIMEWDPATYGFGRPAQAKYAIVANIPYYITGEVIRKFLTAGAKPSSMTLMLQKEVADRIVARDGKESLLSISVKVFGTPKYGMTVKAGSFTPAPTIDSAVLHIADISNDFFEPEHAKDGAQSGISISESRFFEIVRAGFAHKRKQLGGNLSQIFEKAAVENALRTAGVSEKARSEDLNLEQWRKVVGMLF